MALPKINTPTYDLTLPSTGKKIKYRPILVREEKIQIKAFETEDMAQITNAVVEILNDCILTKGVSVNKLATFDIEYLFLNVRAKSVGETVEVNITCPDDGKTSVQTEINIDSIKVKKVRGHKNIIKLDDQYSMKLKYPSITEFIESNFDVKDKSETLVDKTFKVIADCIDTVYTEEDAWEGKDYTPTERVKFIEQLNSKQYKEVEKFFSTMPKLSKTIEVINPNTQEKSSIVLEGLADFFG